MRWCVRCNVRRVAGLSNNAKYCHRCRAVAEAESKEASRRAAGMLARPLDDIPAHVIEAVAHQAHLRNHRPHRLRLTTVVTAR